MVAFLLVLAACTSHSVKKVNSVSAIRAEEQLQEQVLLDVNVVVFNPGVTEEAEPDEEEAVFPQVRKAEARYVPYVLRNTLEKTNQWGAVRVLPDPDPTAEITVTGTILQSDGFTMELDVVAYDVTGRVWLEETYEDTATQFAYRDDIDYPGDPFQDIYNRIANDLLAARQDFTTQELARIRTISELKYAAQLAPDAFGDHLSINDKGQVAINRLPADTDPMLQRVDRIRESEYLVIDTLDQQYGAFYRQMDPSYQSWRQYSYQETLAVADLKRSARARTVAGVLGVLGGAAATAKSSNPIVRNVVGPSAALGGLSAIKQGYDTYKESALHRETLRELAASFDSEVKPLVVNVEGEVVKLDGSLEAQYRQWRELLRQIYAAEVGLPLADEDG